MRYKVVLVPFPFDELAGNKVRPAVCLTDAVGPYHHVVLAFITSVVPAQLEPTDLLLDPGSRPIGATGLRVRSVLRLHRLITVPSSVILRQLGCSPDLQADVQLRLVSFLPCDGFVAFDLMTFIRNFPHGFYC
ncbi:MAG TPA: type II toxin-antitoxin system PemK/MazF family toxin [Chthoniobacteraceae bacterium]|jgi:mRNA interferase MazF